LLRVSLFPVNLSLISNLHLFRWLVSRVGWLGNVRSWFWSVHFHFVGHP